MDWLSAVAFASTGGAGTGAAQQVGEFVLGWLFIIVGIGITAAVVVKGVSLLADDRREGIIPFLITLLFAVVLIGSSRQIATAVTGFAGGAVLDMEAPVTSMEMVGYFLGDILWWAVMLTALVRAHRWWQTQRTRRTIEDGYVDGN